MMNAPAREHEALVLGATIGICFWLIMLNLVIEDLSIMGQINALLLPLFLKMSHYPYRKGNRFVSIYLGFCALWALLWLIGMTVIFFIGD